MIFKAHYNFMLFFPQLVSLLLFSRTVFSSPDWSGQYPEMPAQDWSQQYGDCNPQYNTVQANPNPVPPGYQTYYLYSGQPQSIVMPVNQDVTMRSTNQGLVVDGAGIQNDPTLYMSQVNPPNYNSNMYYDGNMYNPMPMNEYWLPPVPLPVAETKKDAKKDIKNDTKNDTKNNSKTSGGKSNGNKNNSSKTKPAKNSVEGLTEVVKLLKELPALFL